MSVTTHIDGDLAHVVIDNPPVNASSQVVRQGLLEAVGAVANSTAKAVILSCKGRTFVAGADVREFGKPPIEPHLPDVLNQIEASEVPWIAALHGSALGGGLEIALACAYRVAKSDTKLGLPEVTLGLIPGAGGTVRLPRLVDPREALALVVGGRPIDAEKALAIGLVDTVVDDLMSGAVAFATRTIGKSHPAPLLHRPVPRVGTSFSDAVEKAKAGAKGQNSVVAAAEALERSLSLSGPQALSAERQTFLALKEDPQAVALRHMFFAERSVSKIPAADGATPNPLSSVGVIGGGTMGSGIAAACLLSGLNVTMVERDVAAVAAGTERVTRILAGALKRGKLSETAHAAALENLSARADFEALHDADLVIEAVFEDMDVKAEVFAKLDAVVQPDAILASNTSYLDVAGLAAKTKHPDRVIGLHFFSPAHIMKLLEVVVPETASPVAIATGLALGKRLKKIAVPTGVCDGFIGNRIMSRYRREADYMIIDGALPQDVDAAMRDFGFPMGVFQMQDLAGLDIAWAMRKRQAATRDPSERYVTVADQLCEAGRFGRKSGRGWYDYSDDPKGRIDPTVTAMIEAEASSAGVVRQTMSPAQIMSRILDVMATEGAALLEEGIAASPEAIDVVMVNGYGFPRWRGGPMFMRDLAEKVVGKT